MSFGVLEGSVKETFVIKIVCKKITAEGDYQINHKTKSKLCSFIYPHGYKM